MNCWWNWGPDLNVTWKLCSSLEDSLHWMLVDILSITNSLYLLHPLPLSSLNSLFLPPRIFFLWRIQCRMSFQPQLIFLIDLKLLIQLFFGSLLPGFLNQPTSQLQFLFLHYFCLKALSHECSYCSQQNILCLSWLKVFAPAVPSLFLLHLYNLT